MGIFGVDGDVSIVEAYGLRYGMSEEAPAMRFERGVWGVMTFNFVLSSGDASIGESMLTSDVSTSSSSSSE